MKSHCKLLTIILLIGIIAISAIYCVGNQKQDINQLTDNQLMVELINIKGIGEVTAQKVVSYRKEHKPITIAELDGIKGIGEKRLSLIKKKFK